MRRTLWMLTLLCGLAACSSKENNTKIVVVVWSDLTVPTDMDSIRIDVKGPTASPSATFPLTTGNEKGKTRLPVVLALVPPDNNSLGFDVTATGYKGPTPIVSQEARLSFRPGESRVLTLFLGRACLGKTCSGNNTCSSGSCDQAIDVDVTGLPVYDPKAPLSPPDAGAGPSLDGGADGGAADGGGAETGGMDAVADERKTGDSAADKPADLPVFAPDSGAGDGEGDTGTGGTGDSGGAGGSGGSGDAAVPDAPGAQSDVPIGGAGGGSGTGGSGGGTTGSGGTTNAGGTSVVGGTTSTGGVGTGGAGGTGGTTACQESATRCSGASVQTCTNGQWGAAVACGPSQACAGPVGTAKCATLVCSTAGDLRCNGDNLEICNADRTAYTLQQACAAGLCDPVNRTCDICQPNALRCATATQRAQCSANGQAEVVQNCLTATPRCVGSGTCVQCTPPTVATDCNVPNDCNDAVCSVALNNTCQLSPHAPNSICHTAGTGTQDGFCNAAAQCVQCVASSQCIPADDCHTGACGAAGTCSFTQRPPDSTCAGGYCSSTGSCVQCTLASQCSARTCFNAACTGNACTESAQTGGTGCGGTNVCDGAGNCVQCYGVGQQQCAVDSVCRSNACVIGTEYRGWKTSSGSTSTLNGDVLYLKHIPALQYPALLKSFGVVGTGTGATIKFALYADNANATTPAPTGAPLAQSAALGLQAGIRETAAVPATVTLAAGASYWIAIKLNVALTASNALAAGTGTPPGESVAEVYSDPFETFAGTSIPGSFGTEIAIYITVQDTQ